MILFPTQQVRLSLVAHC